MKFLIKVPEYTEEKLIELDRIIEKVFIKHFGIKKVAYHILMETKTFEVYISNKDFFEDLEKAKKELYDAKNSGETSMVFMQDFISDLQERLSFVPIIDAVDE